MSTTGFLFTLQHNNKSLVSSEPPRTVSTGFRPDTVLLSHSLFVTVMWEALPSCIAKAYATEPTQPHRKIVHVYHIAPFHKCSGQMHSVFHGSRLSALPLN